MSLGDVPRRGQGDLERRVLLDIAGRGRAGQRVEATDGIRLRTRGTEPIGSDIRRGERLQRAALVAARDEDPVGVAIGVAADRLFLRRRDGRRLVPEQVRADEAGTGGELGDEPREVRAQLVACTSRRREPQRQRVPGDHRAVRRHPWHWLRTMFRCCGIRRVDHGVGAFSRARYSGDARM